MTDQEKRAREEALLGQQRMEKETPGDLAQMASCSFEGMDYSSR